ncbi:hypothetical protein BJ508DRAFT_241067 [Ascobolus immersus RN42]|uniref:DDE Tnp4 domain-containing protein n=1 Tax=Ascobolus immersus RN42 TaxID=1160509 RepID=A0A3N4I2M5_ASCIM|nr:hypothetical protein BJ508DRAFT_241067 [Ascobolus immersus RN42]
MATARRDKRRALLLLLCLSTNALSLQLQLQRKLGRIRQWKALRRQRREGERAPHNPPIQYCRKRAWSITKEGWDDTDCLEYLRFTREEVFQIIRAFGLTDNYKWRNHSRATAEEAFCLFLFRLSHPHRLKDCMKLFGKSRTWCSHIFNDMACLLARKYKDRLEWDSQRLNLAQLQVYADAVEDASNVRGIWGFIDGTHRGIARPVSEQQDHYAGAKKEHGIRYQGIVTPDGLVHMAGPWLGPTGDWRMWQESGMETRLRELFKDTNPEDRLYLYGDPAYYPGYGIMGPFRAEGGRNFELTKDQEAANVVMSGQRIVVEWIFGIISRYWTFTAFKRSNRVGLSPVAAYYLCAALLTNIHTCLRRRNQISDKFDLEPPTLKEYLGIATS